MDPLATARYGMQAAQNRLAESATRVARMADDPGVDLAQEAVTQVQAKTAFTANAGVIRIADKMWQSLLDLQSS